jgi:hypothetical protein
VSTRAALLLAELFSASPLRHAPFRRFYFGSIGAALHYDAGDRRGGWMATLTPSPLMVALVRSEHRARASARSSPAGSPTSSIGGT